MNIKDIIRKLKEDLNKINFHQIMVREMLRYPLPERCNLIKSVMKEIQDQLAEKTYTIQTVMDLTDKEINELKRIIKEQEEEEEEIPRLPEKRYIEGFNLIKSAMYLGLNVENDKEYFEILEDILGRLEIANEERENLYLV